jgi:hypothetical protein
MAWSRMLGRARTALTVNAWQWASALMQPASDSLLGWVTAPNGRQFFVRQLRDAKIKPLLDTFNAELLDI